MLKLQGIQIKEGVGKEEKAINFLNTSKIKVEECDEEMIEEELIVSLNEMAKKYGQIKCYYFILSKVCHEKGLHTKEKNRNSQFF